MKIGSITKLARDVEYTIDKEAFKLRLMILNEKMENIELLWKVYKLFVMTDYSPCRVRELIQKDVKYKDVADAHKIGIGTLKRQVYDFTMELERLWGGIDIIEVLRNDSTKIDREVINNIEVIIDDSIRNSNIIIENLEDKFSVDILTGSNLNQSFKDIDRDDFMMIRNKLVSFSKPSQNFILKNTDSRLISYGVYLLVTPEDKLNEEDRSRKRELETFTKIR